MGIILLLAKHTACGMLVLQPGSEPHPMMEAHTLTTEPWWNSLEDNFNANLMILS